MAPQKKLKILFVTSELFPFIKTGGLADVSAALPQMLTELGHEVRILVPKYGAIDSRKYKIHDVVRLKDIPIKIGDKDVVFSIRSSFLPSPKVRVQIYFLDNQEYFSSRKSLYKDPLTSGDYKDNDERFILLNRAIFELVLKLGWIPDIIHCNDWQCGLAPAYLKTLYKNEPQFEHFKILFTIHNLLYLGNFPKASFEKTGLPAELNNEQTGIIHEGKLSFMKSGLIFADVLNTVSDGYAKEIVHDKEISGGLNKVLEKRKSHLFGVVNGIDDTEWHPSLDKYITAKYDSKNLAAKEENKKALVERFGLPYAPEVPVIGVVSRLYESKGIDILLQGFTKLMKLPVQVILLGTGEKKYHAAIEKYGMKHQDKFAFYLGFSDEIAHWIEAGADMFLMPSKYEPCGLNQMYSLVYGTVPIVRQTGGLAVTVERYNEKTEEGNGFMFKEFTGDAMVKEVERAVKVFTDKKAWHKIIKNGMKSDFTWKTSAKEYVELYKKVLSI
ncbi:MAG: glycogen synthase GlgA [Ignavibacteriales bacterium]|nr:glycogen synthase GlgA [Ignavibacteriales bacterium]